MRRAAKWAGLVVCVLAGVAWAISLLFVVKYKGEFIQLGLGGGCVGVTWGSQINLDLLPTGLHVYRFGWGQTGFGFSTPKLMAWHHADVHVLTVPIWTVILCAGIPTFLLWRRERRAAPARCRC